MPQPVPPETPTPPNDLDSLTFYQVQVLLAEKRTALSTLRTGIAVFAFPLSVLSVLIATSKSYRLAEVMHWMIPLLLLNVGLLALGFYLVTHSVRRLRRFDAQIDQLKRKSARLAELLD